MKVKQIIPNMYRGPFMRSYGVIYKPKITINNNKTAATLVT